MAGKMESMIRQTIEAGKKKKIYDKIKKKKTLSKLEKNLDNETPDHIKEIFKVNEPVEKKPYQKMSTFDVARKQYDVEERKRQQELTLRTAEKEQKERARAEYYKKRNTEKGRMLERKNGQPVMKHMINNLLSKIKKDI